jgi:hypothetical protein
MTQPDLTNVATSPCEICIKPLKVDEYIVPKIIPTRTRVKSESQIKVKGDPGFRVILVASIVQAVHFDCLLALRLHDAGLIERVENAGTSDAPSTEAVPESNQETGRSPEVVDDKSN